ncbi:MAG: dTDP-4-dehydrorhamnose reductase [Bacteroidota bacterium]
MLNILITGSNGQLGFELRQLSSEYKKFNCHFTDVDDLDITKINQLEDFFKSNNIDFIINSAAYTAVDKAETDIENANLVNVTAVENLVDICKKYNCKLIHVSTDYVFDGNSHIPYKESDQTNPIGVYAVTKLEGEKLIIDSKIDSAIIRTSWLYSTHGNNFVKTIMRLAKEREQLGVLFDQVGTPTYAADLAAAIFKVIENYKSNSCAEIFHFSNEGAISWFDFAKSIVEIANINCQINPIETYQYPTPAKRPAYSILNKAKIKETYSLEIPYWRDSLKKAITILSNNQ